MIIDSSEINLVILECDSVIIVYSRSVNFIKIFCLSFLPLYTRDERVRATATSRARILTNLSHISTNSRGLKYLPDFYMIIVPVQS